MATNTLHAHVEFSFKGENYALETTIDLDDCLAASSEMPNVHQQLAQAGNIDTYSYLYEVLESYDITFDRATGLAEAFCLDGRFDWDGFVQQAGDQRDLQTLRTLVVSILDLNEFDTRPELRAALLTVYRAGKAA